MAYAVLLHLLLIISLFWGVFFNSEKQTYFDNTPSLSVFLACKSPTAMTLPHLDHPLPNQLPLTTPQLHSLARPIKAIKIQPSIHTPLNLLLKKLEANIADQLSEVSFNQSFQIILHCTLVYGKIVQVILFSGQIDPQALQEIISVLKNNIPPLQAPDLPHLLEFNLPIQIKN